MASLFQVVRGAFNGQAGANGFQIERLRASFLPRRRDFALLLGGEGRCPSGTPGYLATGNPVTGSGGNRVGRSVIFAQVAAGPDLDQDQGDATGVFQRMGLAKGHKEGLAFAEKLRLAIPCYARSALNHCPMFGTVEVVARRERATRFDPVASDLIAVAGIKLGARFPDCTVKAPFGACWLKLCSESAVHDCHLDPLAAKVAGKWLGKA